jgi:antitoxin CptB
MLDEDINNIINNVSRLQWACRRGMLELDVLLGNFLKQGYQDLSLERKKDFVFFLSQSDPDLFDWLMGHSQPTDPTLAQMTETIRRYVQPRI